MQSKKTTKYLSLKMNERKLIQRIYEENKNKFKNCIWKITSQIFNNHSENKRRIILTVSQAKHHSKIPIKSRYYKREPRVGLITYERLWCYFIMLQSNNKIITNFILSMKARQFAREVNENTKILLGLLKDLEPITILKRIELLEKKH